MKYKDLSGSSNIRAEWRKNDAPHQFTPRAHRGGAPKRSVTRPPKKEQIAFEYAYLGIDLPSRQRFSPFQASGREGNSGGLHKLLKCLMGDGIGAKIAEPSCEAAAHREPLAFGKCGVEVVGRRQTTC